MKGGGFLAKKRDFYFPGKLNFLGKVEREKESKKWKALDL